MAIASRPATEHLEKVWHHHLSTTFEILKCMEKVPYQLSLLQAEQTHLLQSLLTKEIPRISLALLAAGADRQLMVNLSPIKTPRCFSAVVTKCGKFIISDHSIPEF